VPVGTPAPDGLGATTAMSPSAEAMTQGPWVDASVIKPLQAGASIPVGSVVQTVDGAAFDLNAAVAKTPTVLVFYRGGWCPYCSAHLRDLQKSVGALREMGYQLLAVSTDTPAALRATMDKEKLDYQLLSDSKVAVAGKFGLTYKVIDSYLAHVKNDHHTDLVAQNGGYLLTPAVYVLDKRGQVRFVYANNNYTVRLKQDALLTAARNALR
jgi:peroxiredoxin